MPRERLNPPGLFKHPYFTRILKVKNPATVIFMAGHTPADENYQPVYPGDLRGQYKAILDALTYQLKEAGATWDDVVFRRMYALDVPAFMEIVRDPTFPEVPHFAELFALRSGSKPGGRLFDAWNAVAASVQLDFGLVLPQLTPAAMVSLWRRAGTDAVAAPGVQATAATVNVRPLTGPTATSSTSAIAVGAPVLQELRGWLTSRLNWRPA